MAVSPADFELYSRATGTPLPRTPQEQMQMAPQVYQFIQNRGYQNPQGFLGQAGELLAKAALVGGGLALANKLIPYESRNEVSGVQKPTAKRASLYAPSPTTTGVVEKTVQTPAVATPERVIDIVPGNVDQEGNPIKGLFEYEPENVGGVDRFGNVMPKGGVFGGKSNYFSPEGMYGGDPEMIGTVPSRRVRDEFSSSANIPQIEEELVGNVGNVGSLTTNLANVVDRSDIWGGDEQAITTSQGFNRPGPAPRDVIEEVGSGPNYSRQVAAPTPANVVLAGGRSGVANPRVVGWEQEGEPILKQPKAAFTNKDLQFPFPNRTNPGMAFIAASTEAPTTGIPGIDEVSVPVLTLLTGMHIPGIGQAVTTAGPYIAGLGRQAAGDIVDTARFAGSGLTYVAENLRPILNQGRADIGKGIRDLRQGYEDIGILGSKIGAAHDKYLVQPTQRLAGNIQLSLPTSSFQESDPVETGGESILNDHPDVAQEGTGSDEVQNNRNYNVQGNVDLEGESTSEGGNIVTKLFDKAKAVWDQNTEIANEIAREDALIDQVRSAPPAGYEAYQRFDPRPAKKIPYISKVTGKPTGALMDAGGGSGVEYIGITGDGDTELDIDWQSKNPEKTTPGGYRFNSYLDSTGTTYRDSLVDSIADPRITGGAIGDQGIGTTVSDEIMDEKHARDDLQDKNYETVKEWLDTGRFGYGEDQVSPGKFAQKAKKSQATLSDFIAENKDRLGGN